MSRIQGVLFDWAGTTVDYGSRAPTQVFIEIFRQKGIEISELEARGPMGLGKRDHLAALLAMPRIAALWSRRFERKPTDADVELLYRAFLPRQKEVIATQSDVIPGVAAAVAECRRQGLKIGSTTGYTRELMRVVVPIAAQQGYAPDATVCSDEVPNGRPAPDMNLRAAEMLELREISRVVVVDDTHAGIAAGRRAGAIPVAVSQTGNELGLSEECVARLPIKELNRRIETIAARFRESGAAHVIRSVADLPALLATL